MQLVSFNKWASCQRYERVLLNHFKLAINICTINGFQWLNIKVKILIHLKASKQWPVLRVVSFPLIQPLFWYLFWGLSENPEKKSLLPPCRSALEMHIRRVNYQVFIWVHAHENSPELPNMQDSGWKLSGGDIEYQWTEGNLIVPHQLVEILCDESPDMDDDQQDESIVDKRAEMTNMLDEVFENESDEEDIKFHQIKVNYVAVQHHAFFRPESAISIVLLMLPKLSCDNGMCYICYTVYI